MIVKCIKLADVKGEPQERSPWLTKGASYVVLSVCVDRGRTLLRLIGDDNLQPALHSLWQFVVTDTYIPGSWSLLQQSGSNFELTPPQWAIAGFWSDYFDQDKQALITFDRVATEIISESKAAVGRIT